MSKQGIYSLALSVYFKQPKFGMKKHEILSRASAFLLNVDPKETITTSQTRFPHLEKSIQEKEDFKVRDNYSYEPAGGPRKRNLTELNWLEFVPNKFRPMVHVVTSSHVVSPWRFPDYYGQDWIQEVEQEHCAYSLDVINSNKESLARFACNPYPLHHPQGLDLAIIHLKDEEATLKQMERLGVERLYLRQSSEDFKVDEPYLFDGYEITEQDNSLKELDRDNLNFDDDLDDDEKEDDRIFIPFQTNGSLKMFSPNRFLASTDTILPQGVCGGPIIQAKPNDNHEDICCGLVEGIVPQTFEDKRLAGCAAFIPSHTIKHFIDAAEEFMVKEIVPDHLYDAITRLKLGQDTNSTVDTTTESSSNTTKFDPKLIEKEYNNVTQHLQQKYSPEMYEKIMDLIEKQKKEVIDIADNEGGDLDEIIQEVAEKNAKLLQQENESLLAKNKLEDKDDK